MLETLSTTSQEAVHVVLQREKKENYTFVNYFNIR